MRRNFLFLALGTMFVLASCKPTVHGSGTLVEKKFPLEGFTSIKVGNTFRINVTRGSSWKVSVKIDDNLEKYLRVSLSGKTLVLTMDPVNQYDASDNAMLADIQLPLLDRLELSGASRGSISGIASTGKIVLELSGATGLSGDLKAKSLAMEASGASKIKLAGEVQEYKLELSGASKAHLGNLLVKKAQITLSGASDAQVKVTDELSLDASGACDLEYVGKPKLRSIRTSGASTIKSIESIQPEQP